MWLISPPENTWTTRDGTTWISRGFAELALAFIDCGTLARSPHLTAVAAAAAAAPGRANLAPFPGSSVALDLVAEVWLSQLQGQDCWRADPTTSLLWGGTGAEVIPTHLQPLAVEKIAHRFMGMGELALLLITFIPLGHRPSTSLEQHSIADLGGGSR